MKNPVATIANKPKIIRVGHGNKLTNINDLPMYKGRTALFGLPVWADVGVTGADKHDYSTVVYMNHPLRQYVYDLMVVLKGSTQDKRFWPFWIGLMVLGYLFKPLFGLLVVLFIVWMIFWLYPAGERAARRMAENAKDFTPDTWRGIYRDVAESIEREDEMARAFRKSGGGWGRW